MVTVSDIERPIRRFISRDQLEGIKNRVQRLPHGDYWVKDGVLCCASKDGSDNPVHKELARIVYPGLEEAFKRMKRDLEDLITHVEQADQENDYLLSLLEKEEEEQGDEASGD